MLMRLLQTSLINTTPSKSLVTSTVCFDSLTDAILPLDPQTLYVFCGDYLDRGVQNKEMLNWVIEHRHDHNIIWLEGNHERHIRSWLDNCSSLMSKDAIRSISEATEGMNDSKSTLSKKT